MKKARLLSGPGHSKSVPCRSVQLGFDLGDAVVDQRIAVGGGHLLGDHVARGGHGDIHRLIPHIPDRPRLGALDLVLGGLQTPRDRGLDVVLGLGGGLICLLLGLRDDTIGLVLHFLLLALIACQQGLCLFTQRARLVEFGLDALRPLVELLADQPRHLHVGQEADEQQERQQHHEIGVAQRKERAGCSQRRAGNHGCGQCHGQLAHGSHPFIRALIAAVTLRPSALPPMAVTISAAVSLATSRTLSMALSRISASFFSPSAVRSAISASASSLALSRSALISALVSATIFCASARASASALLYASSASTALALRSSAAARSLVIVP